MSDIDGTTQDLSADGGLALPTSPAPVDPVSKGDHGVAEGMAFMAAAFGAGTPAAEAADQPAE